MASILVLNGALGAASEPVKQLQLTLKNFAAAARFPQADPGTADGVVGPKTVAALASVINTIPGLGSTVRKGVNAAILAYNASVAFGKFAEARTAFQGYITAYAAQIAALVAAWALKFTGSGPAPGTPAPGGGMFPAGTITTANHRGGWRIAIPRGGLAGSGLGGNVPLGASAYVEVADNATAAPPTATTVTEPVYNQKVGAAWYKKWWGIGLLAAGGVATATGGYFLLRKKRGRR